MTPYAHTVPTLTHLSVPEPSKRIHRMVELSRRAGMTEADITKVQQYDAI